MKTIREMNGEPKWKKGDHGFIITYTGSPERNGEYEIDGEKCNIYGIKIEQVNVQGYDDVGWVKCSNYRGNYSVEEEKLYKKLWQAVGKVYEDICVE